MYWIIIEMMKMPLVDYKMYIIVTQTTNMYPIGIGDNDDNHLFIILLKKTFFKYLVGGLIIHYIQDMWV